MKKIYTTLGSQKFLQGYVTKFPSHNLTLLQPTNAGKDFQIVDSSNLANVFENPLSYSVLTETKGTENDDFYSFNYFSISAEDIKMFLTIAENLVSRTYSGMNHIYLLKQDSLNYVILSTWNSEAFYQTWINSDAFKPMQSQMLYYQQTGGNHVQNYQKLI